jgi:hypothetical protein
VDKCFNAGVYEKCDVNTLDVLGMCNGQIKGYVTGSCLHVKSI